MNEISRPTRFGERREARDIPLATQKVIAKLWLIHDALKRYPDGAQNRELLCGVIDRLLVVPLPVAQGWSSPEESWIDQQVHEGFIEPGKRFYVLDCMTSEARYDDIEVWSRFFAKAIDEQEQEVPLPPSYERDPEGPTPYDRLRRALKILPDDPSNFFADVWVDRAIHLELIPSQERGRYLDIFLNIREKAEDLMQEEKRRRTEGDQKNEWSDF